MTQAKSHQLDRGYLKTLLALKLRQLEHNYERYADFIEASGVDKTTIFRLLRAQSNVTIEVIEELAHNFGLSVWEMLNAPVYLKDDKIVRNKDIDYRQIERKMQHWPKVAIDDLTGGARPDWDTIKHKVRKARTQARREAASKIKPKLSGRKG